MGEEMEHAHPRGRPAGHREHEPAAADVPVDDLKEEVSGAESATALREQLEAARAENEEQLRGWQRAQADFVNFRRRVEQERADLVKSAEAGLILDVLPVLDDLERALTSLPPELRGLTWVDGILLIERKLRAALDLHGLKPLDAVGKEFDPLE